MRLHPWVAAIVIVLGTSIASGQVATGTPPFGSFGGGPFDTVNLGNLNAHFQVPVLHKAGRGVPFDFDLSYDSSVWTPVKSSGVTQWQPASNWGWLAGVSGANIAGYISGYSITGTPQYCYTYQGQQVIIQSYSNFVYYDPWGRKHPLSGTLIWSNEANVPQSLFETPCPAYSTVNWGISGTATDGSGYSYSISDSSPNYPQQGGGTWSATVVSPGGSKFTTPMGSPSGGANVTDRNGNEITADGAGHFYDTLSSTIPVLTVAGSGTPTSPLTFSYPAPSGANASYTMKYLQYTVKTGFGVTGVSEYGPVSNALVSGIELPDGTSYTFTYEPTPVSCTPLSGTQPTCVTGRIASVTLPTGGEITYTYTGGNNGIESDGSTAGLTRTLSPGGEWQYARTQVSGSHWQTQITSPPDPVNSGSASDITTIDFQKDGNTTAPTYYFYETQRVINQGASTILATIVGCYNANYSNCTTTAVSSPITQVDLYRKLPNGSTRLSESLYNASGLVTDDKEYTYGVAAGAAPGSTDLIRETAVSYYGFGEPSSVKVFDWSSGTRTLITSSTYSYDQGAPTATSGTPQHVAITGARGNLTTITTSTSSTASLSKTLTYYDTGTPYVVTEVNGAQTTYVYGSAANPYNSSLTASCGNSFPTTIQEPLSLSRSIQWNCIGSVAEQVTDENSNNVTSNYTDADFWRPANVIDQLNYQSDLNYIGQTAIEASLQNFNNGNSVADSRTTIDGFGRPTLSQRLQGPSATNYDTVESDYDIMGRQSRSTMPFSATAGTTNSSAPGTIRTYDALGRLLSATDAGGGKISYTYTNNDVLQTLSGAQTFQKQLEYDGLGRLTSVCEISSTLPGANNCGQSNVKTGLWTKYTYDALGRLLAVTQNAQAAVANQQTRTFAYDWLGRMTSESNPETGNGGTNGTSSYTYDSISPCADGTNYSYPGNLVQKKDNAGNYTCYAYDAFHRLVKAGNSGVSNTIIRKFLYDSESSYPTGVTVSNAKTHMVEAQTINTSSPSTVVTDEFFSYSARGETTDLYEATPHSGSGIYYHTIASFWATGSLKSLSGIPGVPTINYGANGVGLDGEGRYTQITASSGANPVTNVTYSTSSTTNPLGALTGVTFGSADSDSFTYDPNTGRMGSYSFSVNGKTDSGTLMWNTNGTLQQLKIVDNIPGTVDSQTCNYQYDDVQRISSSLCGSIWSQTFTYDSFGNVTKSGSITFTPGYVFGNGATTNQFFSIPSASPSYDANGNLLTDNLNSYTWDKNWGNMLTVTSGSTTVTAIYDALGRMVENNAGGSYSEFVYAPTGAKVATVNGTTLVKASIALPGGVKAVYNTSGLAYYRHSDWLGSSRLTSTATVPTSVYFSGAYAPFGEQYAQSGTAWASFTGQDSSTASSLYDFPFRELSPSQGRWISPDPLGRGAVTLANPQTWNRYAYVANNPLSLVDPTGLASGPCAFDSDGTPIWYCPDDSGGGGGNGCISGFGPCCPECGDGGGNPQPVGTDGGGGGGGGAFQSAKQLALNALSYPPCAQAVAGGTPSGTAQAAATLGAQNGATPLATIDPSGSPDGDIIAGTLGTPINLPGSGVPSGGYGPPVTITLYSLFYSFSMSSYGLELTQAIDLLHEVAHAAEMNNLTSAVVPDSQEDMGSAQASIAMSAQNQQAIASACFLPDGDYSTFYAKLDTSDKTQETASAMFSSPNRQSVDIDTFEHPDDIKSWYFANLNPLLRSYSMGSMRPLACEKKDSRPKRISHQSSEGTSRDSTMDIRVPTVPPKDQRGKMTSDNLLGTAHAVL